MKYSLISKTAAGALLAGVLAACGGGGGGDGGDTAPVAAVPAPTSFTIAGTAATGAPFAGATVSLIDSTGEPFTGGAGGVVTADDGSYTITLPITAKPPFVVQAARDDKTLVSVVAEAKDTTTNITPVTNLIASRLSTSGDPAKLADEIKANPALVDAAAVQAKVAEIVALIKPLMDAVGDSTDPLNGKLVADGSGADKVLDSLSISITPSSATSVNIEVAVKQKQAEGVDPAVIAFTNTTKPATAIAAVTAADLVPSGTATLIADLRQRMTACYAVPLAERVTAGGTAADIIAPACKDIFLGNDPASYKHNGSIVSKTGAWSSIFSGVNLPGTAGIRFDRGSYEFTRANGDLVVAIRSLSSQDNATNSVMVVRTDTDGKLRVIGNQYKYNGGVSAYHQLRTFINQPAATYYSTGYTANVNNTVDANGNPIFAKVVVTTPKGGVLTLKPTAGSSYLPLVKGTTVTRTNYLRLSSVYADAANSAKNPADADTTLFFAPTPMTDAELAAIPAQANWKFDYYLAGNATATPDATQYYKTRARAMTVAELQTQPLAALSDEAIASAKANTKENTSTGDKFIPTPASGPITLDWVVPAGALAPTGIQVWGGATVSGTFIAFNDGATVGSTSRSGSIFCSAASASDKHCSAGNYVPGGINSAHLWAGDATGREFASLYAAYTVGIP